MPLPHVLESIVDWLKAGYPSCVPDRDYVPLLALLARRLTNEEVAAVASRLSVNDTPRPRTAVAISTPLTSES